MLNVLLKTRLQMLLHGLSGAGRTDRSGKARKAGKGGIIALAITLPMVALVYFYMLLSFFNLLAKVAGGMELQWLHYALAAGVAVLLSVFGSVFSTQSQLFDAKDNELLLSMPVKPRDILISRLLLVYLLNLLFTAIVMIPCGIAAVGAFGCTAVGVIGFVLVTLLLPMFSTALCCLLGWLLSLLTSRLTNKAIINTLMTVVFIVVFYIVYFRFINIAFNEDGNALTTIAQLLPKLERVFSQFLAPFYWIGRLFAEGNLLCALGAVCALVLPLVLAIALLSRSFFKITLSKSGAKKRIYRQKELRVGSPRWALVRKELKRFTSSTAYLTNCSMGLLMLLAASVFLLIRQDLGQMLAVVLPQMGFPQGTEALLAVLALCFLSFGNTMTAPSVSLEGKMRWIVQTVPMDMSNVLLAKVDMQLLLTVPVLLFASVAFAVCLHISGIYLLLLLVLPQIMNLLSALAGVWLNVLMPKYEWASETVPVKQSAPVAILMFGAMLYAMIPAILYFAVLAPLMTPAVLLLIYGGISALLCAALWLWIRKKGGARFLEAG